MNAVEYLKAKDRFCNDCKKCPLSYNNNFRQIDCGELQRKEPEVAVGMVAKWAKEHPPKTYLSVLLEKLPKTSINEYGVPKTCPDALFGEGAKNNSCNCPFDCVNCWNREYKEETNE